MEGESACVSRESECEMDIKTTDEPQSSSARVASIDAPVDTTQGSRRLVYLVQRERLFVSETTLNTLPTLTLDSLQAVPLTDVLLQRATRLAEEGVDPVAEPTVIVSVAQTHVRHTVGTP